MNIGIIFLSTTEEWWQTYAPKSVITAELSNVFGIACFSQLSQTHNSCPAMSKVCVLWQHGWTTCWRSRKNNRSLSQQLVRHIQVKLLLVVPCWQSSSDSGFIGTCPFLQKVGTFLIMMPWKKRGLKRGQNEVQNLHTQLPGDHPFS